MKIGFISDLRLDTLEISRLETQEIIFRFFLNHPLDVLVFNGNTSTRLSDLVLLKNFLKLKLNIQLVCTNGLLETRYMNKTALSSIFKLDQTMILSDGWALLPTYSSFDLSFHTHLSLNELTPFVEVQTPYYCNVFQNPSMLNDVTFKQFDIWKNQLNNYSEHRFLLFHHFIPDFYFSRIPQTSTDSIAVRLSGNSLVPDFIKSNPNIAFTHFGNYTFRDFIGCHDSLMYLTSTAFSKGASDDSLKQRFEKNLFVFDTERSVVTFRGNEHPIS